MKTLNEIFDSVLRTLTLNMAIFVSIGSVLIFAREAGL